ncbi:MAG TPA: SprT family zinc-dependent metalloprotease [Candidatus Saccharimonadales bacterium]|nr:SprT family zinc-dependent metalloprotease [Candidatus Saccharimonadales bacterium]
MAQKVVDIQGIGTITLAKRKGARNLRITIRPDGSVRVGMPSWTPYEAGIRFAKSRAEWIERHRPKNTQPLLSDGSRVGKSYRLEFCSVPHLASPRVKVANNRIIVSAGSNASAEAVQKAALRGSEKALRKDAEKLLGVRLDELAAECGYRYRNLSIKKLKSRWGSCSSNQSICLNFYLIQLPWRLIDYVIIHELVHTRHMNHSKAFWDEVGRLIPEVKQRRAEIKRFRPLLIPEHSGLLLASQP